MRKRVLLCNTRPPLSLRIYCIFVRVRQRFWQRSRRIFFRFRDIRWHGARSVRCCCFPVELTPINFTGTPNSDIIRLKSIALLRKMVSIFIARATVVIFILGKYFGVRVKVIKTIKFLVSWQPTVSLRLKTTNDYYYYYILNTFSTIEING